MRSRTEGIFLSVIFSAIGAGMLLLAWVIWSMFASFTLFKAPKIWPISNQVIHPGDEVFTNLTFCKYTNLPSDIGRMLVGTDSKGDEYLFLQPNVIGTLTKGCYHKHVGIATVPINAPPGKYKVAVVVRYSYSAFRTVQNQFDTEVFEVATNEGSY